MQSVTATIEGLLRNVVAIAASLFFDRTRQICRYLLRHPITLGETTITAVVLRWPAPDHAQALMRIENDSERILEYLALMTGLPLATIDEMDLEDIDVLGTIISRALNGENHVR